jgi:thiol-disulfide isomerase/thioredoxin
MPTPRSLIIEASQWFNTAVPPTAESLAGKVVMVEAFQLLCPGCVSHALPQAQKVHSMFDSAELAVIGLHTVFEHHAAQGRSEVLQAFLHEYRLGFPIAVDKPSTNDPIPTTMRAYGVRGTPSLLLFSRAGELVLNHFGAVDDIALGVTIGRLLSEPAPPPSNVPGLQIPNDAIQTKCDENACQTPDT